MLTDCQRDDLRRALTRKDKAGAHGWVRLRRGTLCALVDTLAALGEIEVALRACERCGAETPQRVEAAPAGSEPKEGSA